MITPPSSNFKPILNDQDYMELVFENGQIFAKTRSRSNNNGRTQSLWELYESEYDEGFLKCIKNLEDSQVVPAIQSQPHKVTKESSPPDEESVALARSTFTPSSSMFSLGTSTDLRSCSNLKRKYEEEEEEEEDEEEESYLSDISDDAETRVPTGQGSKDVERKGRNEINKKMRILKDLLPNCYEDDKVSLLEEAIKYLTTLQLQHRLHLQMMSIRNGLIRPPTMFPMDLAIHMNAAMAAATTSIPQFLPMNVHQESGFPGMNNASSHMLNFLNHSQGLFPNLTLDSCSHQFVVPNSYVPQTQATSYSQFSKFVPTSNLENATKR